MSARNFRVCLPIIVNERVFSVFIERSCCRSNMTMLNRTGNTPPIQADAGLQTQFTPGASQQSPNRPPVITGEAEANRVFQHLIQNRLDLTLPPDWEPRGSSSRQQPQPQSQPQPRLEIDPPQPLRRAREIEAERRQGIPPLGRVNPPTVLEDIRRPLTERTSPDRQNDPVLEGLTAPPGFGCQDPSGISGFHERTRDSRGQSTTTTRVEGNVRFGDSCLGAFYERSGGSSSYGASLRARLSENFYFEGRGSFNDQGRFTGGEAILRFRREF